MIKIIILLLLMVPIAYASCGDNECLDENPYTCYEDCGYKIFDTENTFCMPLCNCGNWKESWFLDTLVVLGFIFILGRKYSVSLNRKKRR